MLDTVKTKVVLPTKNLVRKHRVAIAVTATSIVWIAVNKNATESYREFLQEKDLYDEYLLQGSTEEDRKAFHGE